MTKSEADALMGRGGELVDGKWFLRKRLHASSDFVMRVVCCGKLAHEMVRGPKTHHTRHPSVVPIAPSAYDQTEPLYVVKLSYRAVPLPANDVPRPWTSRASVVACTIILTRQF